MWVTTYAVQPKTTYFYDFLNVHYDARSDAFTPTAGGLVTVALPAQLADMPMVARFYDADRPGAIRLPVTSRDATSLAVSIPSFRVYGTLVLTGQAASH